MTKRKTKHGDCYEVAAKYMMDRSLAGVSELVLVHGEVHGQGPMAGKTFRHAWVEDGDAIVDCSGGRHIRMTKREYYAIGRIDELNNMHRYTWEEARTRLLATRVYGPWDLQTTSGL